MKINNFHEVLRKNFEGTNLSQLSRELDIPRSVLQGWLQERRLPSFKNLDQVIKISKYLGISLDELLAGDNGPSEKIVTSVRFSDEGNTYSIIIRKLGKE